PPERPLYHWAPPAHRTTTPAVAADRRVRRRTGVIRGAGPPLMPATVMGHSRTCRCRESHPPSSGDEPVLVDESAKDVGASDASGVGIGDWDRFGNTEGALLIERPVRPAPVVVIHVLGEDGF